jgi:hypothetical protein
MNLFRKRILFIFMWVCLCAGIQASLVPAACFSVEEYDAGKPVPLDELREDFSIIRAAFEEGHGALYRYSTKKEMDAVFSHAFDKIDRDMTEREFLRILLPVVGAVNCGHTRIAKSHFFTWLEGQPVTFPLGIRYINRRPYLVRNYSDREDVALGVELVSINGMPMARIIEDLLPAISSDAHIETSKFLVLSSSVRFSQLFNIFYGITSSYEVGYRNPDSGKIETIVVEGKKQADVLEIFQRRYPEQAKTFPLVSFQETDGIPVLTIRTFGSGALQRGGFDYPKFLRETFQKLIDDNSPALVIDLRENGGGDDAFGKMLFAHLMDKDFQYYAALEVKKNTFEFFKYTDLPQDQWTFSENRVKKNERGWYDALGHPNLGIQKPIPPVYEGRVYVLISGRSFSATGETTSLMHFHKKAVFVGEECGAGYYGNTSGFGAIVNLPHTGIGISVPLVRYTMAVDGYPADRGIVPDYPSEPTVEDVINNRDTVLLYAVDLAKKDLLKK